MTAPINSPVREVVVDGCNLDVPGFHQELVITDG